MKSIQNKTLVGVLACGLLVLTIGRSQAQDVPLLLSVQMTATVQGPDNGGDPVEKVITTTVRLTTADVFRLVKEARGTSYPQGACLALWNDTVCVVDKTHTNQLDDLSDLFTYETGTTVVRSAVVNHKTRSVSGIATYLVTLGFDDGQGTSLSFTGLAKTTMSATPVDKYGKQKETTTTTITAVGEGTVLDYDAVASGTITAKGTGTVSAP